MKELIENIIKSLGENRPIDEILLQAQIISFKLGNEEFKQWVHNEQYGYSEGVELPGYRIIDAGIKVDVSRPFQGIFQNLEIPTDIISNDKIRHLMSHIWLRQSLIEIESICKGNESQTLTSAIPVIGYHELSKYVNGHIVGARLYFASSSILKILSRFKYLLLEFFLKLEAEIADGFDFTQITSHDKINKIMNQTYNINAVIANTGNGTISTNDVNVKGLQQRIEYDNMKKLREVISQIENVSKELNNQEITEVVETLKTELETTNPLLKTIKMGLNAIKGVATGIAANQITPYVNAALALL